MQSQQSQQSQQPQRPSKTSENVQNYIQTLKTSLPLQQIANHLTTLSETLTKTIWQTQSQARLHAVLNRLTLTTTRLTHATITLLTSFTHACQTTLSNHDLSLDLLQDGYPHLAQTVHTSASATRHLITRTAALSHAFRHASRTIRHAQTLCNLAQRQARHHATHHACELARHHACLPRLHTTVAHRTADLNKARRRVDDTLATERARAIRSDVLRSARVAVVMTGCLSSHGLVTAAGGLANTLMRAAEPDEQAARRDRLLALTSGFRSERQLYHSFERFAEVSERLRHASYESVVAVPVPDAVVDALLLAESAVNSLVAVLDDVQAFWRAVPDDTHEGVPFVAEPPAEPFAQRWQRVTGWWVAVLFVCETALGELADFRGSNYRMLVGEEGADDGCNWEGVPNALGMHLHLSQDLRSALAVSDISEEDELCASCAVLRHSRCESNCANCVHCVHCTHCAHCAGFAHESDLAAGAKMSVGSPSGVRGEVDDDLLAGLHPLHDAFVMQTHDALHDTLHDTLHDNLHEA